jgi:hypothetical protein
VRVDKDAAERQRQKEEQEQAHEQQAGGQGQERGSGSVPPRLDDSAETQAEAATKELARIKKDAEAKEQAIKDGAANMSGVFTYPTSVKKTGSFSKYATHVKTMISNAEKSKAILLSVIDKLFLIVKTEGASNQSKITIHPALTNELLDQLVNQTRDVILQMYLGCERDFYTGVKLLRVMIEEKMQEKMEASLLKLQTDTKMAIKDVTKRQFLKKETDVAKQHVEVSELHSFKNPLYDEETQHIRDKRAAEKYNDILNVEYEIKNLELALASTKKNVELLETQKMRYENQKKLIEDSNGDADEIDGQINEIENKIQKERGDKRDTDKKIEEKQEILKELRIAQVS